MNDQRTDDRLRVALPNKGRLAERALELLEQAGLRPEFRGHRALIAGLGPDFQAIFVRAADIPEYVADGAADKTGPIDRVVRSNRAFFQFENKHVSSVPLAPTVPRQPKAGRPHCAGRASGTHLCGLKMTADELRRRIKRKKMM